MPDSALQIHAQVKQLRQHPPPLVGRVAEKRLPNLGQRLTDELPPTALLDFQNDLSSREPALVKGELAEVLQLIANTSRWLGLTVGRESLRQMLVGHSSVTWAELQDAKTSRLRAYGETDQRLKEGLDPVIDRIADTLLRVCRALGDAAGHALG
jgi:hypothetical protein